MAWWAALKAGVAVAIEVHKFILDVQAKGLERLGPEAAKQDRRRLQRLAVWFHEGENTGLRKLLKIDDGVDGYIRDVLQSSLLEIYLDPKTSALDQLAAKTAIMQGADGREEPRVYPVH